MNMGVIVSKAMPIAKKIIPIAFGALTGGLSVISDQKAAKELTDMKDRIADLEKLVKKD